MLPFPSLSRPSSRRGARAALAALLVAVASGCQRHGPASLPLSVFGVWQGPVQSNGTARRLVLNVLAQCDTSFSGTFNLGPGDLQGGMTGTVTGNEVDFDLAEDPNCPALHGGGELTGARLQMSFSGTGCFAAYAVDGVLERS